MNRVILHSDMNSFYASVECLYHPEIREKPVAVCGDVEQRHGIILTKNQYAKKYGVATGEPIWQAKQKCPNLICLPARYDIYMKFSQAARKIYERYTDQIEPFGLDECWMDITGNADSFEGGNRVADDIRQTIKRELGVTVSVGVSWNKIFAKLGSDYKKPDAITVFTKENYKQKIWPLPACDLLYVGPATTKKLASYGIHTIGELATADSGFLKRLLGKWGEMLWSFANGYDISPVSKMDYTVAIKSIGNSMTTYRDMETVQEAWKVIVALSESVATRLRANGMRCKTIQISLRDTNMMWLERQAKLMVPSCVVSDIAGTSRRLLAANWSFNSPLRALGVRACDLLPMSEGVQQGFFDDSFKREKWENIESCMDKIRGRFGNDAITRAVLVDNDITQESDTLTHTVHPIAFRMQ